MTGAFGDEMIGGRSTETALHLARAVEGDRDSLGWVVQRFTPFLEAQIRHRLRGFGCAADVEDLAAEAWLVTLRRFSELTARDGEHAPVLLRFLGTTALQLCNNRLRTLARSPDELPAAESVQCLETRGVLTRVAQHELAERIRAILAGLPEGAREVLALRLMEQRTCAEIAQELGVPANTVAVRYRRALERLRDRLPAEVFDLYRAVPARGAVGWSGGGD